MKTETYLVALLVAAGLTTACTHLAADRSLPAHHEEVLAVGRVACTECHEDEVRGVLKPYASFDHTAAFVRNHRLYGREETLCLSCHRGAFCNDCHANETVLKPSAKHGERPDREFVHRGDYMTRHKVDGKLDPGSCHKCHGRANNVKCTRCHR